MAYRGKGDLYYDFTNLVNGIDNYQKAASINRGRELSSLLSEIGNIYIDAGFQEKGKQYYLDRLKLDGDSSSYYDALVNNEFRLANFNKSIEYAKKGLAIDSTNFYIGRLLSESYEMVGQYEESIKCYKKWFAGLPTNFELLLGYMQCLGYAYWQNGYKEEAKYYFNEQIKYYNKMIELKRSINGLYTYYNLAGIYSFMGERDKAYKNLRIFNQIQAIPLGMSVNIKINPLFNSIRNEPEFQQIAKDIEAKYQAEHERVRKWLEEQGTL
jgi:tetratricopeptide (TPR) repeat protein